MASLVSWELLIQSNFNPKLPVLQKFVITLINLSNDEHFIRPKLLLICSKPVLYNFVIRLFIARGHFLTVYIWTSKSSTAEADDVPRPPPWSFLTFHRSQHLLREALQRQVILFLIWAAFDWWNGNMTLWTKWSIVEYWELHLLNKVDIYIVQSGKLLAAGLIFLISFFKFPAKVHMRWQGEWYRLTLIVVQWALKGMGGEKMKLSPVLSSNLD